MHLRQATGQPIATHCSLSAAIRTWHRNRNSTADNVLVRQQTVHLDADAARPRTTVISGTWRTSGSWMVHQHTLQKMWRQECRVSPLMYSATIGPQHIFERN